MKEVVIDGPLLQGASTVRRAIQPFNITLELTLHPELPRGFCGHYFGADGGTWVQTADYVGMVDDILLHVPIHLNAKGCPGTV